jgi:hypothetical protein
MSRLRSFSASVLLVLALPIGAAQVAEQAKPQSNLPAQYAAVAVGQAGSVAGKTFGLTIYIDAVSSGGEVEELAGTLKHKGQDGLVKALDNLEDKGRVAPIGTTGTGMRVIRIRPTKDGGQHITMVTNRTIAFAELYNATRSRDYQFGILILDVDKDGKGTGLLDPLCKMKFNKKNELEVERFGQKPFRLANVYRQK